MNKLKQAYKNWKENHSEKISDDFNYSHSGILFHDFNEYRNFVDENEDLFKI